MKKGEYWESRGLYSNRESIIPGGRLGSKLKTQSQPQSSPSLLYGALCDMVRREDLPMQSWLSHIGKAVGHLATTDKMFGAYEGIYYDKAGLNCFDGDESSGWISFFALRDEEFLFHVALGYGKLSSMYAQKGLISFPGADGELPCVELSLGSPGEFDRLIWWDQPMDITRTCFVSESLVWVEQPRAFSYGDLRSMIHTPSRDLKQILRASCALVNQRQDDQLSLWRQIAQMISELPLEGREEFFDELAGSLSLAFRKEELLDQAASMSFSVMSRALSLLGQDKLVYLGFDGFGCLLATLVQELDFENTEENTEERMIRKLFQNMDLHDDRFIPYGLDL